jgi:hypothetical protein
MVECGTAVLPRIRLVVSLSMVQACGGACLD